MSKILTYQINGIDEHNTLVLRSKVSFLDIKSVYTINNLSQKIELIPAIQFNGLENNIGVSYESIRSKVIYIDANVDISIVLDDVLTVKVSNSKYVTSGIYRSQFYKVDCGQFIQPVANVVNQSDVFIDCSMEIKLFDRYNNIRQQDFVPIILNDDGNLVFISVEKDTKFILPLETSNVDDIVIYVENNIKIKQSEYSLGADNKTVIFDSRNLASFVVIYKPKFYTTLGYTQINTNLFINKDNLIKHTIKDIDKIEYRFILKMTNLDFTTIDETPIIKTLGIITY